MQFIDKTRIVIKAGDGGDGCAAFHRQKYVPVSYKQLTLPTKKKV